MNPYDHSALAAEIYDFIQKNPQHDLGSQEQESQFAVELAIWLEKRLQVNIGRRGSGGPVRRRQ